MKSVSNPSISTATLAASVLNTAQDAGGVAVMEAPVAVKPARTRKPRAPKVPAPVSAPSPVLDGAIEKALDLPPGTTAALAASVGKKLRDPKIAKKERKAVNHSAVQVLLSVGLGEQASGYGPILRQVMLKLVKSTFNLKSVKVESLNTSTIKAVLSASDFASRATAMLDQHVLELELRSEKTVAKGGHATSAATLKARDLNTRKAQTWITSGLNKIYLRSMDVVCEMGGQITIGGITMPFDRLLAISFGKSINAIELYRASVTASNATTK